MKLLRNERWALKQDNNSLLEQIQTSEVASQDKEQRLKMAQLKSEEAQKLQREMQQRFKETEALTG